MSAAVAALLGALIGAAASVITIIIQQRYQNKRELIKIASDLALADYMRRCEVIAGNGGGRMPPISAFVHYHAQVIERMAAGTFTPEVIKGLSEEHERILSAYTDIGDNRKSTKGKEI